MSKPESKTKPLAKPVLIPWPEGKPERMMPWTNEPCDMLIGPCACGAWHTEEDDDDRDR